MASRRTFVGLGGGVLAAALSASARGATSPESVTAPAAGGELAETRHRTIDVGGLQIFYREAGPATAPVLLLLHGFPTSSRMFRNLMPMLADKYRVIAPDYPAFGHSAVPFRSDFHYTHAHLSDVVVVVQNAPRFGEPTDGPLWAAELAYWKDGSPVRRDDMELSFESRHEAVELIRRWGKPCSRTMVAFDGSPASR
jgi:alpha/beta hydrolase family protein